MKIKLGEKVVTYPMRVDKEKRHLPNPAYPNEIAYFFSGWVCKNKDGQWWVFSEKPLLNEKLGKWIPRVDSEDIDIPNDRIIDPEMEWNEGLWRGKND